MSLVVSVVACSGSDTPRTAETKTQAQRDSAVGQSGLPGSKGVMGALGAADSARARAARQDSIINP